MIYQIKSGIMSSYIHFQFLLIGKDIYWRFVYASSYTARIRASVDVDNKTIGSIERGFLVLLGVADEDTEEDMAYLVKKITQMRIFEDEAGKMNLSLKDVDGELLIISQFTLFASTKKGNRRALQKPAHLIFLKRCI